MTEFANKTVLVTGGSQGIGLGIAQCFAEQDAKVHITGTRASADEYEDDLSSFTYHQANLSTTKGCKDLNAEIPEIDVLVNNAGIGLKTEFKMEDFRKVFEVNLFSAMELSTLYLESLSAKKGAIVNVGSLASHLAIRNQPAYTASKSAIYGLTRSLADKWAPLGVNVNMVAPGFIETRMTEGLHSDEESKKKLEHVIPIQRMGAPREIGNAVAFLASEKASYIVGTSLQVDGGLMVR